MGKSAFKLTIISSFLAILLLGLVQIITSMSGLALQLELAGFFFLVLLIILGFIGYSSDWGEHFFFFTFIFYLTNLVLLWYFTGLFYLVLLLITLAGFGLSFPNKQQPQEEVILQTPPPKPQEEPEKTVTTFSPGKYVASARSNMFHEPKCEWAAKIKAKKLWFANREEAEGKQYKKHSCVKN